MSESSDVSQAEPRRAQGSGFPSIISSAISPLRILYVAQLQEGSTALHRANAMRSLGHEVVHLNQNDHVSGGGRIVRAVRYRLNIGPGIPALNRALVRAAAEARPGVIWIDKGVHFRIETLQAARKASGAMLVHFNPDDPFGLERGQGSWRLFLRTIPVYDLHVITRDVNFAEYRAAGARRIARFVWAYEPSVHRQVDLAPAERERLGGEVGFVGHYERERAESMHAVARNGVPVRIWGPGWEHCTLNHDLLKIERRSAWGEDYVKAVCAFPINLGFLRKRNRDLSTQRSIEIPACGSFLLAERTEEHQRLFKEGEEAEFFGDDAELLEKVRYYVANPEKRAAIARRGHERCLAGGYSNAERIAKLLEGLRLVS